MSRFSTPPSFIEAKNIPLHYAYFVTDDINKYLKTINKELIKLSEHDNVLTPDLINYFSNDPTQITSLEHIFDEDEENPIVRSFADLTRDGLSTKFLHLNSLSYFQYYIDDNIQDDSDRAEIIQVIKDAYKAVSETETILHKLHQIYSDLKE